MTEPHSLRINWILARPSLAGGVKSNRLIAEAMVRRGHDVRIAYVDAPPPRPSLRRPGRMAQHFLRQWQVRGKPRHHLMHSTAQLIPVPGDRIRAEDVPDADVSIAGWWQTREWIEAWPASKGLKAHFIRHYEIHGGDPERVKAVYRLPGLKLVIAKWLQRLMAEQFNDPHAVLVPNGVDWSQFNAPPRDRADAPTVGMLYGDQQWKGADTAFAALRRAQEKIPELRVIAFGRVPVARDHQPPANFEFHLRPAQQEIPRLYQRANCWLVPSTSEGFGMPGLEAAACRCPVVSTRCGGPEDYVADGESGFLVDVGDPEAMAAAIVRVLQLNEQEWRAMSDASYRMACEFDWDRSAERLERALYDHLAAAHAHSARHVPGHPMRIAED